MTRIEIYKEMSRTVDFHLKIINFLKIQNNKTVAMQFYTAIINLVNNYYRFNRLTFDAKNYFINRIANNTEWIFKE